MYIVISIFLFIILFSGYIVFKRKLKQYEQKIKQKLEQTYIQENKQILESQISQQIDGLKQREMAIRRDVQQQNSVLEGVNRQVQLANNQLRQVNDALQVQRERAKNYEAGLRELAEESAKTYQQDLMKIADVRVAEAKQKMEAEAKKQHEELMVQLGAKAAEMSEQLSTLTESINTYSAKQAAINEAILRQRAIDEQQDFYRVCLSPDVANDVELLNTVRRNLKKPEIIDKIIYDNYIAKPVLEMIKRVLQNSTCSGIYKITCIKTGEIYIGKSTDIKNRWQQHCKTVFNCGTIASSLLHTKMKQYGIENFTFELVEAVPKDQLSEREKFYINFYQTKEVGLNERNG